MNLQQIDGSNENATSQLGFCLRKRRRWIKRLGLSGLLLGLAVGGWAFENEGAVGLKGILPAETPEVFSAASFEALGPTWKDWSAGAVEAIAAFYRADGDVAAQRAALNKVKAKLGVLNKAISDSQYSAIQKSLLSIRGPLARQVALAEAILKTLEADPAVARSEAVAASTDKVNQAVAALKADLQSVAGGSAWLPFIQAEPLLTAWGKSVESEETVAALNATKSKLALRETLTDAAQKAFLSRPSFIALESAINEHLTSVAINPAAVDQAALRAALAELTSALDDYEYTNSSVSAAAVRAATGKVAAVAADRGAAIRKVLTEQYFNYNIRIAATESFLNRLLADSRVEQGQVNDYVLGAAVGGWQTTSTNVGVDVQPSADKLVFDLVLTGVVQSNTAGHTDQATIYTSGYHQFRSTKQVAYDGHTFTTSPAYTSVSANNTTTGASTRLSGVPLFGQVAQRVAIREATARRPQAESIAAGRVTEKVTPRFNQEVDQSFANATADLERNLYKGLKEAGLYPDREAYSSTHDKILISTRLMGDHKLGGYSAEPTLLNISTGAAMLMHESVVNNTIDLIGFDGKTMNEEELRAHVEQFLSKALSREFKFNAPAESVQPAAPAPDAAPATEEEAAEAKAPAKLKFVDHDSVRVQFRDGQLLLTIRAGLERENADPIPAHEIVVPLTFTVNGNKLLIKRDTLSIAPIEGNSNPVQQKVMNTKISAALPDREVAGTFKLKGPSREVNATITGLSIVDGWITVNVQ